MSMQISIDKSYKEIWDTTFKQFPLENIPWITRNIDDQIKDILTKINIPENICEKALDIGCGIGTLSEFLIQKYKEVNAIDVAELMIDICKRNKDSKVNYFETDFLEYNTNEKYDLILSHLLLHHIREEDVDTFFSKIHSMIKKGGDFLMTCLLSATGKKEERAGYFPQHTVTLYTVADVINLSEAYFSLETSPTTAILESSIENFNVGIFLFKVKS